MSKVDLRLDWCSYQAARYAVEHWHYSHNMPRSKMMRVGVWENGDFVGCVIFSYGATPQIGSPYGLRQMEIVELTRVALREHITPVSRIVMIAVKMLYKECPGLRLLVSFADSAEGHHGGIYQAAGWIYTGVTGDGDRVGFIIHGQKVHTRTIGSRPGGIQSLSWVKRHMDQSATEWIGMAKYRYLYPLDSAMRVQIEPLRKPYPKRETRGSGEIDNAAGTNPQTGGASPTDPLLIAS